MSRNKIALSFALAGILGASTALAENEGWFVGGYLTQQQIKTESNAWFYSGTTTEIKYGILGGYHQGLGEDLGIRYYGAGDLGAHTTNLSANVDVLYSFLKNESLELRGFGGGWLGYANHSTDSVSGFDLGINLGVRAVFAEKHGAELYGHFGFLTQDKEYSTFGGTTTLKLSQPYQIGLRYTFSF